MLTDIKLSKAQLSKIIQVLIKSINQSFSGFLVALLDKLVGSLIKVGATFTKSFLAPLATMASASAINYAIQRKMHGKGVVRAGKRITLLF